MAMIVKNLYTGKVYEAIQFSYDKLKECEKFIREHRNVSITPIMPKIRVYGLTNPAAVTEISPSDFIIRTKTDKVPLYKVVSQRVLESNFDKFLCG